MSRNLLDGYFDPRYLEEEIEKAYLQGFKQGRTEGYDKGCEEGEIQGFNHGRKQGYNDGFNDGEKCGYENGYDTGYDKCKEITMNKYNKLIKMAIKPFIRKDFKKDMTIVKKNTMAPLYCFTLPPLKFLMLTHALKQRTLPISSLRPQMRRL
jgi:hypothetical protein